MIPQRNWVIPFGRAALHAGIGVTAALISILPTCTLVLAQNPEALVQDFVGNWKTVSVQRGAIQMLDSSTFPGMQLEPSNGRIIGFLFPALFVELAPAGKGKLEGKAWIFGVGEKAIQIPTTVELTEDKNQLTLVMRASQVDKTSLSNDMAEQLAEDYTIVAQQTAGTVLDLRGQVNRARQAEGKSYVGSMNRASQAYFIEYERFASSLEELQIGIKPETESYAYSVKLLGSNGVQTMATPKLIILKSYTGGAFAVKSPETGEMLPVAIVCESEQPSKSPPPPPMLVDNQPQCPPGFQKVSN